MVHKRAFPKILMPKKDAFPKIFGPEKDAFPSFERWHLVVWRKIDSLSETMK